MHMRHFFVAALMRNVSVPIGTPRTGCQEWDLVTVPQTYQPALHQLRKSARVRKIHVLRTKPVQLLLNLITTQVSIDELLRQRRRAFRLEAPLAKEYARNTGEAANRGVSLDGDSVMRTSLRLGRKVGFK